MEEDSGGKYLCNLYFKSLVLIKMFDLSTSESLEVWIAGHFWLGLFTKASGLECVVQDFGFKFLSSWTHINEKVMWNIINISAFLSSNFFFCYLYQNAWKCHDSLDGEIEEWKPFWILCCDSVSLRGRLSAISGVLHYECAPLSLSQRMWLLSALLIKRCCIEHQGETWPWFSRNLKETNMKSSVRKWKTSVKNLWFCFHFS